MSAGKYNTPTKGLYCMVIGTKQAIVIRSTATHTSYCVLDKVDQSRVCQWQMYFQTMHTVSFGNANGSPYAQETHYVNDKNNKLASKVLPNMLIEIYHQLKNRSVLILYPIENQKGASARYFEQH